MKHLRLIYGLPIILIILVIFMMSQNLAAEQRLSASPLSYEVSLYSEEEWLKIGRDSARSLGMIGDPERESWTLLTRGSYLTMMGSDGTPPDREAPLFIYQAFGDIPTFIMYGLDGAYTNIGGMTLVFDGQTGMFTSWAAYPKDVIARGETGLDLSFIPADAGANQQAPALPVPTLAQ